MHIVIVNRWPRFHDGQRWDNELTRYEAFFDHHAHRISYVVDGPGALGVLTPREQIAHMVQVEDVNQYPQLLAAVTEVIERVGPVDLLIALSEFTLDFANATGYPLIVKPVDGAASIGVVRVDDERQLLAALDGIDLARHEVEAFVEGQVYHVDGYTDATGQVPFQAVSRYLNSCLDFARYQPLGSVLLQASPLRTRIADFSRQCLQALGLRDTAFHLELFVCEDGRLVFLEVGARVGGSEVPHLINRVFGVNLYEHWLKNLLGEPATLPGQDSDPSGGWLIIPKPRQLPCTVLEAPSQRTQVASLWRELLPQPGEVLEAGGGYDALQGGRFIFTGSDQAGLHDRWPNCPAADAVL